MSQESRLYNSTGIKFLEINKTEFIFINSSFTDDIGLIKLKDAIMDITPKNSYYKASSVCFPPKDLFNTDYEEAILSGYGNYKDCEKGIKPPLLQTGNFTICSTGIFHPIINRNLALSIYDD